MRSSRGMWKRRAVASVNFVGSERMNLAKERQDVDVIATVIAIINVIALDPDLLGLGRVREGWLFRRKVCPGPDGTWVDDGIPGRGWAVWIELLREKGADGDSEGGFRRERKDESGEFQPDGPRAGPGQPDRVKPAVTGSTPGDDGEKGSESEKEFSPIALGKGEEVGGDVDDQGDAGEETEDRAGDIGVEEAEGDDEGRAEDSEERREDDPHQLIPELLGAKDATAWGTPAALTGCRRHKRDPFLGGGSGGGLTRQTSWRYYITKGEFCQV